MKLLIVLVVVGACFFAYFVIGDLFDRFFPSKRPVDPEELLRRERPYGPNDRPGPGYTIDSGGGPVFRDEGNGKLSD